MPNYIEDVTKAGWKETGKFWTHPDQPGKKYWSAIQVYEAEEFPGKRPYSITKRDEPAPAKPLPTAEEIASVAAAEALTLRSKTSLTPPTVTKPPLTSNPVGETAAEAVAEAVTPARRGRPPKGPTD